MLPVSTHPHGCIEDVGVTPKPLPTSSMGVVGVSPLTSNPADLRKSTCPMSIVPPKSRAAPSVKLGGQTRRMTWVQGPHCTRGERTSHGFPEQEQSTQQGETIHRRDLKTSRP